MGVRLGRETEAACYCAGSARRRRWPRGSPVRPRGSGWPFDVGPARPFRRLAGTWPAVFAYADQLSDQRLFACYRPGRSGLDAFLALVLGSGSRFIPTPAGLAPSPGLLPYGPLVYPRFARGRRAPLCSCWLQPLLRKRCIHALRGFCFRFVPRLRGSCSGSVTAVPTAWVHPRARGAAWEAHSALPETPGSSTSCFRIPLFR